MAVLMETSLGDLEIDLFVDECPQECLNFLKLCKCKYYNYSLFHRVVSNFVAQAGDPNGTDQGGESVWGLIHGPDRRYFPRNDKNRYKHARRGTLSFVNDGADRHGSQFFITLADNLDSLDGKHSVFGEIAEESFEVLDKLNRVFVDDSNMPYQDIRHTIVLDDPFDDPEGLPVPDRSPVPTKEQLESGRIGEDEAINEFEGMSEQEVEEIMRKREARGRAQILEMIGDLPDADIKPPENVLFVCKLHPVTRDEDLRLIFSRFGKIRSCAIVRDWKTGDSLQYAFIEFEKQEEAEEAYFKMDNVLIDDRRIHVDFSQSVCKLNEYALPAGWKLGESKKDNVRVKRQGAVGGRKYDNYDLVFDGKDKGKSRSKHSEERERATSRDRDEDRSRERSHGSDRRRDSRDDRRHRDRSPERERSRHRDDRRDRSDRYDRGGRDDRGRGRDRYDRDDRRDRR